MILVAFLQILISNYLSMYYFLLDAATQSSANPIFTFLPFVLILVVFYFFMIRPQQKRQKAEQEFRNSLKKGDNVLTIGGIHGKIVFVDEKTVMLEISPNVKIKIEKSAIRLQDGGDATPTTTEGAIQS